MMTRQSKKKKCSHMTSMYIVKSKMDDWLVFIIVGYKPAGTKRLFC